MATLVLSKTVERKDINGNVSAQDKPLYSTTVGTFMRKHFLNHQYRQK
jgi:hypothetical protein